MRHLALLAPFACAVAVLGSGAAAHARPLTAQDLATLDRVSDAHVSPDGRLAAYDLRSTDYAANKGVHSIWLADLSRTAAPRRLAVSDGGATGPRWSPDGRTIYFISSRSGSDQVWRTDLSGAAATQVTNLPLDVGTFRVSPDGRRLVVSMAVFPDCETPECTKARMDERKAAKTTGQVFDRLFVRHWDEWADGTRNHLFSIALDPNGVAAGPPVPLTPHLDGDVPTKPFGGDEDYVITPDGRSVIFSARIAGRTEPWSTNFDLFASPVDGSAAPRDLTAANPAWDAQPVVSPDGRRLAYRAQKRPGFESDRYGVMVMDLATGASREVDPQWDRSAEKIDWSADGRTLYVIADDVGRTRLFAMDPVSGAVRPLTDTGHVSDVKPLPGGALIVEDAMNAPAQLFRVADRGGAPLQLTHADAERLAGIEFSGYEQFSFPGWNGETVHGYVVRPNGYQPGRKYPVVYMIHGGPQGSWTDSWSYRWNPEVWAGWGYGVVMVDFHGSTGYGQAFTDAISGHWGDRPLEDLQKGWAAALTRYPFLDGARACAAGASYGGFMINWIAGNWKQPWKCLIVHDGVFDNVMMGYSTEELWFSEWENGHTTPWENRANYERFNPINYVQNWSVPQLVIHGGRDYRIPLEQGLGAFGALQRKGVPSRLLYFPDESHWVLKPQNSVEWHATIEDWLHHWIGG